jgi:hypothetical protein
MSRVLDLLAVVCLGALALAPQLDGQVTELLPKPLQAPRLGHRIS